MSFAKLNKAAKTVAEGINTKEMSYTKLKEHVGETLILRGFFFTQGKFGKELVCVTDETLINMPKRYVGTFEAIQADTELLTALLAGKCAITNIHMGDTNNGTTVFFDFDDVE